MADGFKAGDVVNLKSGGPPMTVSGLVNVGDKVRVRCTWFAGAKNERADFVPEALELAKKS